MLSVDFLTKLLPFIKEVVKTEEVSRLFNQANRFIGFLLGSFTFLFLIMVLMLNELSIQAKGKFDAQTKSEKLEKQTKEQLQTIEAYKLFINELYTHQQASSSSASSVSKTP